MGRKRFILTTVVSMSTGAAVKKGQPPNQSPALTLMLDQLRHHGSKHGDPVRCVAPKIGLAENLMFHGGSSLDNPRNACRNNNKSPRTAKSALEPRETKNTHT